MDNYGLPCEQLWRAPVICPDGTVLPCCMVNEKKYAMGNMFEKDFQEIWNGVKYQSWRKVVGKGGTDINQDIFCRECMFSPVQDSAKVNTQSEAGKD